jgi:ribosomal protein S18 acetylase RimI-like enzyme
MEPRTPLALQAPNTTILIRPVQLMDTDGLVTHCWPNRSFIAVHNLTKRAIRCAAERRGLGLVAVGSNGEVCAYGQMVMWPTCAEISDMIVAEAYRGQGLGTAIIQSLVQTAIRIGADEIEIGAALTNPRAVALYRRLGFEDSHTVMLNLDNGKEKVLFLRLTVGEKFPRVEED